MPIINDPDGLSQGGETSVAATTFAGVSGAQITITSVNVPAVTVGDFIEVRDALTAANNGLYEVDTYNAGVSIVATKQALTGSVVNPANDASSQTIRTFGTDANEKNIMIDTSVLRFSFLNGFGSTTILDDAGVVGQSCYSFFKEEWKNDNDLIKFEFPMVAITPEQFEFVAGWLPVDESESTIVTTDASDTRALLRTAGWDEVDVNGFITNQYFGWVTLGNIDASDFAYGFYDTATVSGDIVTAVFDGAVNEAVQSIIGGITDVDFDFTTSTITRSTGSFVTDGFLAGDFVFVQNAQNSLNDGSFEIAAAGVSATVLTLVGTPLTADVDDAQAILAIDRRTNVFTPRIRVFGKTYDQSSTTAIGVTQLTNQVYRFPLAEAADAVITDLVTTTVGDLFDDIITVPVTPYDDMSITYYSTAQDRSGFNPLGGDTPAPGDAQFGVIIDADVSEVQEDGGGIATAEEIYAYAQARLGETSDINDGAGTLVGQLADTLLSIASTGNDLFSVEQILNPEGGGEGVYVDTFLSSDKNRVNFTDNDSDVRSFPFVATFSINFNANLSTDVDAVYRVFFTNDDTGDNSGRDFGTIDAITVQNASASDIAGAVPQMAGGSSLASDYDYDGNDQRGSGSESTDAPITLVAIGLGGAQYVIATGTITAAENQTFGLVAALERNYSNP